MKRILVISLFTASVLVLCAGCGTKKKLICGMPMDVTTQNDEPMKRPDQRISSHKMLAPITIYRTRADYARYVPITLSPDKSEVLSYPSRFDVGAAPRYAMPVDLGDGYLWDQRGISPQSAFLDITYEEYAALTEDLTPSYLLKHILDSDPFTYIARCDRNSLTGEPSAELLAAYCRKGLPGAEVLLNRSAR